MEAPDYFIAPAIRCHQKDIESSPIQTIREHKAVWLPAEPAIERVPDNVVLEQCKPWRRCSYCGSIHPDDLILYIGTHGARMYGTDWKYGWPHKFYVDGIPNPYAGRTIKIGISWMNGESTPIMGEASKTLQAKWYNKHLMDLDVDKFEAVRDILHQQTKIKFTREQDGVISYSAPYYGYQQT